MEDSAGPYKLGKLLSVQGKDGCKDPRCSRMNGKCVGYHCADCGKPSSMIGHPRGCPGEGELNA